MQRRGGLRILLGLTLLMPACIPEGLAFVQDNRLEILSPEGHADVDLPVTVEWEIEDFEITGPDGTAEDDAGYFGVFLDATPVPPGKSLEYVARDDRQCVRDPNCPDVVYLSDRNVYSTTETEITFKHLPDLETATGRETHEVTIVLLDGTGHRIGESAWYQTFFYQREGGL